MQIKTGIKKGEQYQYKIYGKPHTLSFELAKIAGKGPMHRRTCRHSNVAANLWTWAL